MVDLIAPADAMFLLGESREHPMHVGSLQLYEPPAGAGPDFAQGIYEKLSASTEFQPTFRKHPAIAFGPAAALAWTYDDEVDLDYHLRRSALPRPGRVRELLELASRLHSGLLDRHRPLWEQHIIEGLADGRMAVYTKVHHALIDGASAQRLLQRTLSDDPDDTDLRRPWNLPRPARHREDTGGRSALDRLGRLARDVAATVPSTAALARSVLDEQTLGRPFGAPRTMFNVPIGGARRIAAQSWPFERIRAVKKATGTSVNDVVLAMCAAALRSYLAERQALPADPLIAMVPVSLRAADEVDAGGNLVGTILCNLATQLADPAERLATIAESMSNGKQLFAKMPRAQALAVSALLMSPLGLNTVPGFVNATRPPFNLVISNVPGPLQPMYWQGARLVGNYPLSIALDGQAMNITLATNADQLDFGIVGCRRSVPSLQRLLGFLEDGLAELERATT